jgi:signal transduction histidine kinase
LKHYSPCFVLFFLLFAFSCKQKEEATHETKYIDSLVNAFRWPGPNEPDTSAVFLHKLLANPNTSTVAKFKIYSNFCGYYYLTNKSLSKSLLYADSMINLIESADPILYSSELAQGYYSKGDVLFALGKFEESFDNYHYAKKIMSAKKDNCTNSDYSYRIGMVLYKQGKYADARYFFNQAFEESADCKQDFSLIFRRQELLNNEALCYSKLGQTDNALASYNKALNYINKNDTAKDHKTMFEVARGVVYGNIGGVYFTKKAYKEAEEFLKKSIDINVKPSYENNDAALTQVKLVKLYLELKDEQKAYQTLLSLKKSVDNINLPEALTSYHLLFAQYLERKGNKAEAYNHLLVFTRMTDSAQKQLNKLKATDINERFKNLDSQSEIDYLKREKHIQKMYLYVTILFSVMSIAIILLIYFYWKKSKKNVKLLTQLNDKINYQKMQLEETLIDLEKSNKEKDSLLRAVAHDLRNPIGGISSLVGLMIEEDTDEEIKQQHQLIKDTCLNALALINELIEAAESNNTVDVIDKTTTLNIVNLVTNAIELLKFKAQEKQQKLKFEANISSILVNGNREKILRVISNLISNAIKFSEEQTTIEINIVITDGFVQIRVADQGIGIPTKFKDNVFKTFTASKRPGTKGEKSYGLGLSISKQIVNAHNGEIWFEPNEPNGTRFYFSLPMLES